jgi:cystathionine beta-lyase/cystathionine gamma-synthase
VSNSSISCTQDIDSNAPAQTSVMMMSIETLAVHGGDQHDKVNGAIVPPITTATTFIQPNLFQGGEFCYGKVDWKYS